MQRSWKKRGIRYHESVTDRPMRGGAFLAIAVQDKASSSAYGATQASALRKAWEGVKALRQRSPRVPQTATPVTPRTHTPATSRRVAAGLRFDVLKRDGFRCRLCGAAADDGVRLHVDHITAYSRGGETTKENLWTLCAPCNIGKSNKSLDN